MGSLKTGATRLSPPTVFDLGYLDSHVGIVNVDLSTASGKLSPDLPVDELDKFRLNNSKTR